MLDKIYFFYTISFYIFNIYNSYKYIIFMKKITDLFISATLKTFNHLKNTDEIEEIYEMILTTEPGKTITIDDTNYIEKYQDNLQEDIQEEYFNQMEGEITLN